MIVQELSTEPIHKMAVGKAIFISSTVNSTIKQLGADTAYKYNQDLVDFACCGTTVVFSDGQHFQVESNSITGFKVNLPDEPDALSMNETIIAASVGSSIRLYQSNSGKPLTVLRGHADHVNALDVIGDTIFSGGDDAIVHAWKTGSKRPVCSFEHDDYVRAIRACAGGRLLLTGTFAGTISLWDVEHKELVWHQNENDWWVTALAMNRNHICAGFSDGVVKVWKTATKELLFTDRSHTRPITGVGIVSSGVLSASKNGLKLLRIARSSQ